MAQFTEITGSTPKLATQYLQLADFNIEQAMQLYFENGGAPLTEEPAQPTRRSGYEGPSGVVHIDSDSDDDDRLSHARVPTQPAAVSTLEDDAAMARRLQEEMYRGDNMDDNDGVRAPMARTTETLVGPEPDLDDDMHTNILSQLRARGRGGQSNSIPHHSCCLTELTTFYSSTGYFQSARRRVNMDWRFRGIAPRTTFYGDRWGFGSLVEI